MNLGYSQQFPWEEPTLFKEKIIIGDLLDTPIHAFLERSEMNISEDFDPKLHSIREDINERWRAGLLIHHVYNNRQKNRECFLVNKCISTQRIIIMYKPQVIIDNKRGEETCAGEVIPIVMIDGRRMDDRKIEWLAKNDGFDSVENFFRWFKEDFNGKIIHWTKLRY